MTHLRSAFKPGLNSSEARLLHYNAGPESGGCDGPREPDRKPHPETESDRSAEDQRAASQARRADRATAEAKDKIDEVPALKAQDMEKLADAFMQDYDKFSDAVLVETASKMQKQLATSKQKYMDGVRTGNDEDIRNAEILVDHALLIILTLEKVRDMRAAVQKEAVKHEADYRTTPTATLRKLMAADQYDLDRFKGQIRSLREDRSGEDYVRDATNKALDRRIRIATLQNVITRREDALNRRG